MPSSCCPTGVQAGCRAACRCLPEPIAHLGRLATGEPEDHGAIMATCRRGTQVKGIAVREQQWIQHQLPCHGSTASRQPSQPSPGVGRQATPAQAPHPLMRPPAHAHAWPPAHAHAWPPAARQAPTTKKSPTRHKQLLVQRVPGCIRDVTVVPPEADQLALHAHIVELQGKGGWESEHGER